MLAWLTASSLAWGQLQPITFTPIDASATPGATMISSNQKVVSNQYGIFVVYLKASVDLAQTQWILKRSVDGGASFTVIDASPAVGSPGVESTNVPLLESDSFGNIYMIRSTNAVNGGEARMLKYSPLTNYQRPTAYTAIPSGSAQKAAMLIDEARSRIYYVADTIRIPSEDPGEIRSTTASLAPARFAMDTSSAW
jgi:hypothetical protein